MGGVLILSVIFSLRELVMYNFLHNFKILHRIDRYIMSDNFWLFRVFDSIYKKINYTKKINKGKTSFYIHVKNGIGLQNLIVEYEDWLEKIFEILSVPKESTVIDIGANTGQTLLKIVPFHPSIKYIAIEPNIYCKTYLEELCRLNNFTNVKVFAFALSNKVETTTLFYRYREDILATTTPDFRKFTNYANSRDVSAITGDELCKKNNIENISLIKIDVEGGEYKVILGLVSTLKMYKPFIVCEILPTMSESIDVANFRKNIVSKLFELISELGYVMININQKKIIKTINNLSQDIISCNYIFCPNGKAETVLLKL